MKMVVVAFSLISFEIFKTAIRCLLGYSQAILYVVNLPDQDEC